MLEIVRFDPTSCGFPKPRIPVLPRRLQLQALNGRCMRSSQGGSFRSFARGRYALGVAYALAGIKNQTTLLAPAYHCLTMLDPALHLGAEVQLYPLNPDLSPNLERLDTTFRKCTFPVKALLATHFFGIQQDFTALKQWCEQRAIVLIEDGSHTLFTESFRAPGIGISGKFVVSSPYKFFPCEDGGLLYATDESLLKNVRTVAPSITEEIRAFKRILEHHHIARGEAPTVLDSDALDHQLATLLQTPHASATTVRYDYTAPSPSFSSNQSLRSASRISRWLVQRALPEAISQQRRTNFKRWLNATRDLPNCRPLYPNIPDDCVPCMFPLYIDHPERHFDMVKHLGVPVLRWDEMAASPCHVASDYRLHLLHLPCHQSLTEAQMDWLVAAIGKVLQLPVAGEH